MEVIKNIDWKGIIQFLKANLFWKVAFGNWLENIGENTAQLLQGIWDYWKSLPLLLQEEWLEINGRVGENFGKTSIHDFFLCKKPIKASYDRIKKASWLAFLEVVIQAAGLG